jgi:cytochrome c oxidase cbb3-type subunit II
MKMTPALLVVGGLMIFWAAVFVTVIWPAMNMDDSPSDIWQPWSKLEAAGHKLYVQNGCSYCHSLQVRVTDWGLGAERISQIGDYVKQEPIIVGTIRTGPDLSQAGGEHTNGWQQAHFINPRFTRPVSLMPSFEWLGQDAITKLIAYVQSLGGKHAKRRMQRQNQWGAKAVAAYAAGPDANVTWIHENVPAVWRAMPNPYPATPAAMARGKRIYQQFCIGCHGPVGDGRGSARVGKKSGWEYMNPPPLNFTTLRRHLVEGKYIGGIFYYQIMNGITGTAMPYFKRELESEKIWDVSNYIAVMFVGYTDANIEPRGIDASYEPHWVNKTRAPATQETTKP